jgi:hypothetical protein
MITRVLNVGDSKQVARLHIIAFSSFFLTKLGHRFLVEFYSAIFQSKDSINVGLFIDDKLIGFAVGAKKSKAFYSNILKKNFLQLGFSAFIPLLLNPFYIYRLFLALTTSSESNDYIPEDAMLLSICMEPSVGKKGKGKLILAQFEEIAFKFTSHISLTTDFENNDSVNAFYIRNGYKIISTLYQGKRKMYHYRKSKN